MIQQQGTKVAVKIFTHPHQAHMTIAEMKLQLSPKSEHLVCSYKSLRHELSLLTKLGHEHIVEPLGVKLHHPFICLLIDLGPGHSLRHIITLYQKKKQLFEPLTIVTTIQQVSNFYSI